jgi:hypothetical protein
MAGMGVVFVAFAICGIVLSCMREAGARARMLLAMSLALLVAYLLSGPVYRAYALHHWEEERAALEPSRFITDLVYFLSVFAVYAMYRLAARYRLELGTAFAIASAGAFQSPAVARELRSGPRSRSLVCLRLDSAAHTGRHHRVGHR